MNRLTFIILLSALIYSCVPNRKIVYLQDRDELKTSYPTDSVLRSYQAKREPYRLRAGDIISMRVASVTGDEYNFISKYELQLGSIKELNQYSSGNAAANDKGQSSQANWNYGNMGQMGQGSTALLLERLNSGFKIDSKGNLDLPQIGAVQLEGLTINQAEDSIKSALQGYYETPMVRVQLLNFHYTILGEVANEGRYTSYDPNLNIFDAFLLAGNLTELADRSQIKIVRQNGDANEIVYLNTLKENLLSNQNFYLQPDDMIIVPPLKARNAQRYTLPRINTALGIIGSTISVAALILTLSK